MSSDFSFLVGLDSDLGGDELGLDETGLLAIREPDLQRRLSSMRAAHHMVALAVATADESGISSTRFAQTVKSFTDSVALYMKMGQVVLDLDDSMPGFGQARLALSRIAQDYAWSELRALIAQPTPMPKLGQQALAAVLSTACANMPERYSPGMAASGDLWLQRRMCLMSAASKVYGAYAHFDFFYREPDSLLAICLDGVIHQAELLLSRMAPEYQSASGSASVLIRAYAVTADVFVESYKRAAQLAVQDIQRMSSQDRAAHIALWRRLGGMPLEPVILRYRQAMALAMDVSVAMMAALAEAAAADDGFHQ